MKKMLIKETYHIKGFNRREKFISKTLKFFVH